MTTAPSTYRSGFCGSGFHDRCRGDYRTAVCGCTCHNEPKAVTVHCFFGCAHTATDVDPQAAHEAMEEHYRSEHWQRIRELAGWMAA